MKPRSYNIGRQRHLRIIEEGEYPAVQRPKTRGDCEGGIRPCPFVSCKFNLYLDVNERGTLKLNFPDKEPDEIGETCALDLCVNEGMSLEEIAKHLNMSRERVRLIERHAMNQIRLQLLQERRDHLDPE